MNKKTKVLQIGVKNWSDLRNSAQKSELDWFFIDVETATEASCLAFVSQMKKRTFDVVLCTDRLISPILSYLSPLIESYALILDASFQGTVPEEISQKKCPVFMSLENKEEVLQTLCFYFFSGQMGSKLHVHTIAVNEKFSGDQVLFGEHRLNLKGDFSAFNVHYPALYWQYNMGMFGRHKKIWLEFDHSEAIALTLLVQGIREGTSEVMETWRFSENELKQGVSIDYQEGLGYLSLSLSIEGEGKVSIGPLHYRDSRAQYGEYLLGGQKIADEQNEELYYYFHPGDLKPPLNVYFSGYRSAEGFEGFYMMKKLGAPFLLITDPRLEGGSFYLGSSTLEAALKEVIECSLEHLGFTNEELVLSGLSMGTFGALYYGSFLHPHSIVIGKPLVNLGTMAEKERIIRPGGFPTSLDLLQSLTGGQDSEAIESLNSRFWSAFDAANFEHTQFLIAYMKDDDYDDQAYGQLLEHLLGKNAYVVGKGIPGRHNDNSSAINQWFINHYQRILEENFYRGGKV
ncbi:accessory Sec system protein Asp2 [Lactococcus petauri]|uniref:accessory Sec system protein Asp2 n=1 Tax=Lactococcus petauri TaxID=1940789 RepID=UPI0018ABEAB9|nr:accessory Sec system protein Asp2 [Lactococcus petauri]MDC0827037.1 accessory Sec system protein Asp2 [Lactococcus petauri]